MKKIMSDKDVLKKISNILWDRKIMTMDRDEAEHILWGHKDSIADSFKQCADVIANIRQALSDQYDYEARPNLFDRTKSFLAKFIPNRDCICSCPKCGSQMIDDTDYINDEPIQRVFFDCPECGFQMAEVTK